MIADMATGTVCFHLEIPIQVYNDPDKEKIVFQKQYSSTVHSYGAIES